jgi:pimeloyl-ACP methyl ester carboxylesterase
MIKKAIRAALFILIATYIGLLCVYTYNVSYTESKFARLSAPQTTRFIPVGDERYAYSEINNGSDTTVVFVGGLSSWNGTWQRVVDVQNTRSTQYNYVALDLPPFGYSTPAPDRNYFRDTQAVRIKAFIDAKQFDRVILVGHSYGGGPVTEYAMRYPERVQKLILIDAVLNIGEEKHVPIFSPVTIGPLRVFVVGLLIHNDSLVLSRLRSFVHLTDHVDTDLAHLYTRYLNLRYVTERLSDWVRDYTLDPLVYKSTDIASYTKLPFPVRVIWGEEDTLTPISGAQALLPVTPDIRLTALKNVGHIPMIEDYTAFDAALSEALDK